MAGEDWPVTREITPPRSPPKERWCWDFAGLEGREAAIEKQVSPLRVNRDQSSDTPKRPGFPHALPLVPQHK
ncbi:glutathione S-transferase [Aspergillus luchuensis]|uniref:Glutathione S-transferase n=1 Tax=Aspergillus kawachii TaxID=1069201 RepID=A0A146F1S5_ASPKA|nr:glutathione S-transferase [Aspergillus luchuensis]